ncbi:uncharacterized protein LOC128953270 [Oppia nitens]|uniref:uncharacterized protein LOC128953270 n=1 Tax=Oppia nitens TaxID=1686743 RepID=UPI0023DAD2D2|nr:uncharacterized protein LOC128953270 [Oppia nitens]
MANDIGGGGGGGPILRELVIVNSGHHLNQQQPVSPSITDLSSFLPVSATLEHLIIRGSGMQVFSANLSVFTRLQLLIYPIHRHWKHLAYWAHYLGQWVQLI